MLHGLDLFSGIGGISLALSPWVRTVAYCECEPFACGVLMSRMANGQLHKAPIWDDVTTLRAKDLEGLGIDIIAGGFPCTDISSAGTREGLAGEHSGLYREVIRLVDEIRPGFVLLENVAAIRARGADVVVGDLAALGYDCRWTTFEAADVGAPHRRDRWWLLASNANGIDLREQPEREQFIAPECRHPECRHPECRHPECRNARGAGVGGQVASNANGVRLEAGRDEQQDQEKWRGTGPCNCSSSTGTLADADGGGLSLIGEGHDQHRSEPRRGEPDGRFALPDWEERRRPFPAIRGVHDGISNRVDRLRVLGNAVVPAAARRAFEVLSGLSEVAS